MICHGCGREFDALVIESERMRGFCDDCAQNRLGDRIVTVNDGGNHRALLYSEVQLQADEGDPACSAYLAAEADAALARGAE